MAERNIFAFQIDFQRIVKEGKEEYYQDFWDYNIFKDLVENILERNQNDIKKIHNGWFQLLDGVKEYSDRMEPLKKQRSKKLKNLGGRFLYAEYGYVGDLRHVDTLAKRKNNKGIREGEEKYVYFVVRETDGLLLLQGDMKLVRSKFEDYFRTLGKDFLENRDIINITVSTLLRGDFIDEVKKLDDVNKIEIELAVEKTTSYENEVMKLAKNQAHEFSANYATITWQSKYRNESLHGFQKFLESVKPRGTKKPIKGVSNIKVIGKQDGEYKRVYLSKISEKYPINVKLDENKVIVPSDIYSKIINLSMRRMKLWRGE
jgi:hypothetical protein